MPHLLGMFVCNLVIAFSSMDALEATVGLGALPLAGALLGELGDGFSLLSYNWLPTG
jgi:hypothetical protein